MNTVTAILVISVAFSIGIHSVVMTIDVIKRWREKKKDYDQQVAILNSLYELKQSIELLVKPEANYDRPVAKQRGGQKACAVVQTNGYSKKEEVMNDTCSPAASINTIGTGA